MKLVVLEGLCPACGHEANIVTSRVMCSNRNCQYHFPDDGHSEVEWLGDGAFDDLESFHKRGLHNRNIRGPEMEIATKE